MKIVDVEQGSASWHKAKLGIPSASNFSKILSPGGQPSKSAESYMNQLLAEYFIGEPASADSAGFMQRGTIMEKEARRWFAYDRGLAPEQVRQVGLCLRDDGMVAASPDALVEPDELLELKVPAASTQISYLRSGLEGEYWSQCQGQLWVTGRKRVWLCAYNPVLPPVVLPVERDEEYIDKLDSAVSTFVKHMLHARAQLMEKGCVPAKRVAVPASKLRMGDEPF